MALSDLGWNRVRHEIPWFCALWRGGCGAVVGNAHQPGKPCPHCGEHAITRATIVDPEPERTA